MSVEVEHSVVASFVALAGILTFFTRLVRPMPSFTSPLHKSKKNDISHYSQAIVSAIPDDCRRHDDDRENSFNVQ